jgi:hypothetical protein
MALHRITGVAAALLLSGCPIPTVDGNPDGGALRFEVGTFDEGGRFVAFPSPVLAATGNQGGIHVGIAYRLPEGGVGDLTFNLEVRRSTDGTLVSSSTRNFYVGYAGPGWTSEEVRVFMCPASSQGPLADAPLRFEVTATGRKTSGVLGSASTTATFLCPASFPMCDSRCW